MEEELRILILYIATWGWQIMGIIFLTSSLILFTFPRTIMNISFLVAFFLSFIICEMFSLKRQKEVAGNEIS